MPLKIKQLPAFSADPNPLDGISWKCNIYQLEDGLYHAKLYVFDEWDGYLARWKHRQSSPSFDSIEAAEAYANEHWLEKVVAGEIL